MRSFWYFDIFSLVFAQLSSVAFIQEKNSLHHFYSILFSLISVYIFLKMKFYSYLNSIKIVLYRKPIFIVELLKKKLLQFLKIDSKIFSGFMQLKRNFRFGKLFPRAYFTSIRSASMSAGNDYLTKIFKLFEKN